MPLNRSQMGVVVAIGVVVVVTMLGAAYLSRIRSSQRNTQSRADLPGQVQRYANAIEMGRETNAPLRDSAAKPPAPAAAAPPAQPAPAPAPKPPPGPTRSWTVPTEMQPGVDKGEYEIVDLTVDQEGTRALLKSKRAICLFDFTTGQILQTYSKDAFLSPDAAVIAIFSAPQARSGTNAVTFQEAATGRVISTVNVLKDLSHSSDWISFTPSGKSLLVPGRLRGKLVLQVMSVADGTSKMITLPGDAHDGQPRLFLPLPASPEFIVYGLVGKIRDNPSAIWHVNLPDGTQTPLKSISVKPFFLFHDRGVALSPDGRLVLAQGLKKFQLCDWRADRVLFEHEETAEITYSQPHFTPDGKRFVVQRTPHYVMMHFGGPQGGKKEYVPVTLELYDVANLKKIAEYPETRRAVALAISANGNTIVYACDRDLYAVDFKPALGIERLAPLAVPADPDWQ